MRFLEKSRLLGGALLLCAGERLELGAAALVSKGRGCQAGQGAGAGELRTHFTDCGGGGASNLGLGANGAVRLEGGELIGGKAFGGLYELVFGMSLGCSCYVFLEIRCSSFRCWWWSLAGLGCQVRSCGRVQRQAGVSGI